MEGDQTRGKLELGQPLSEAELCPEDLLRGQEAAFARDMARLQARQGDFVKVPCPACQGDDLQPAFVKHGFPYVTCASCSTLFMNPRPTPEIMADYYSHSENYAYWAAHIFPASEASRREKLHKPWLQRVREWCASLGVPMGTLLEVGPGFGTFCAVAQESGLFDRVLAVEPTPELAAACRSRGVEVIQARIEDVAREGLDADVVVAFEVLEHLFEPGEIFRQCLRLLKPGGLAVLSCPNGQGFDISLLGPESLAIDPEHVNLLNPASLRALAESCGFQVVQIATPGRLDAEFVRDAWRQDRFRSEDPFLRRVLLDEWDRLGWPFQQFLAEQGLSSHMWLVARKPAPAESQSTISNGAHYQNQVRDCYRTWSGSYYNDYYAGQEAYPPVHRDLVRTLMQKHGVRSLLDAGCGPASMLRDLADIVDDLYGFDLTPEMIEEARRVMAGLGREPDRFWQGSVLEAGDFAAPGTAANYDAAICFGVLPHIAAEDEGKVIANLRGAVRPGGLVALEARNQLFALFTLNRYGHELFTQVLSRSEALLAQAGEDEKALEKGLRQLAGHFRLDLPPIRRGSAGEPGYDQVLSRTHNPLVLKETFARAGFTDVELLFYHYHCLPPMLEESAPNLFRRASLALEDPRDWRGHFMASAFILTGVRG